MTGDRGAVVRDLYPEPRLGPARLTSTQAAQRLGCRITELEDRGLQGVTGPTGTVRYTLDEIDRVKNPPVPLDTRDRTHLLLACAGGALVLASIIWGACR